MEEEASKKYKIGNGAPFVVKTRRAKKGRKKTCPLRSEKRFAQTFLKFDAWCESTRGLTQKNEVKEKE